MYRFQHRISKSTLNFKHVHTDCEGNKTTYNFNDYESYNIYGQICPPILDILKKININIRIEGNNIIIET